jgi:hypothetical protein
MSRKCPRCGEMTLSKAGFTPAGKQRWECRSRKKDKATCYKTTDPDSPLRDQGSRHIPRSGPLVLARSLRTSARRFIITAAQNATPVHENFWKSLRGCADHLKAELLVIPLRYKNPTSRWTKSQENDESWDPKVTPFLWNQRRKLNSNLTVLADVKVQPTASEPLSGFEAMTAGESGILGHTKLQMRSVPTPSHKMAKILTTTGACTVPNYTDSKAGKKGEFHHSLAAVLVEIDGPTFHLRHLNARGSGEFTDLTTTYGPSGHRAAERPLALVMGDTHVDFVDPSVERATFGPAGMVSVLHPQHLVWHDLLDGYSANPHHLGNPFNGIAKRQTGRDDVAAEVRRAAEFVLKRTPRDATSVVVPSNHDDFLRRWILRQDWRDDPTNAEFYLETALYMARQTHMGTGGTETPSPFAYWMGRLAPRVRCLRANESFTLGNVELSMHGDLGPNGARGSIKNLRRIGVRSVIGHSHSPGIEEGCYQTGTSTYLRLEYNGGPSGWLNTHCIVHADGKRQLVTIINGDWRL